GTLTHSFEVLHAFVRRWVVRCRHLFVDRWSVKYPMNAYQQSVDEVLAALGTDARGGLSEAEARARLEKYGFNELTAEKPIPKWKKFLAQFKDVLVILLLVATLISA